MILSIFICEDDRQQRKHMESIISAHAARTTNSIKLALSTDSPTKLLNHLEAYSEPYSLYILDVDLQHEIDGIALAKEIRKHDFFGTIVFVTTHAELSHMALRSRIEMMDYIIKGNPEDMAREVCECIDLTYSSYRHALSETEYFQIKSADGMQRIPLDKIMCFEVNHAVTHRLVLHTLSERLEFRGALKDVEAFSTDFFRCHKSYVVNMKNIKRVKRTQRTGEAEMVNGMIVPVGETKIARVIRGMGES